MVVGYGYSLLTNEPTAKVGIKNKGLMAGWNEHYLAEVLFKKTT